MKSRIITVALTALLIMSVVGCPNDTQTGSSTSANNKITSLQTVIDKASDGDTINLSQYTDITDYNATVNKELTINGSSTSLNNAVLTVENSSTISGITNASVTASSALENGSLKISSSLLSSLVINGGGIGSIELSDVTVTDVTIDKQVSGTAQYVRLQVDGTTIRNLHLSSSALIDTAGSFNANDINITFGNDNADLNVAFRKTIELTTPTGKVKADFAMGETDNSADFYIIVNENAKIAETFYRQVSNKLTGRPIDAAAMPLYHGEDKFAFTQGIPGDMSFRMDRPQTDKLSEAIKAEIDNASGKPVTVNLVHYPSISDYTGVIISQPLTLDGAGHNFSHAALTIKADNVILKNINNAQVMTDQETAINGKLTITDCSMDSITVSGNLTDSLDISDTTVDNLSINAITAQTVPTDGIMKLFINDKTNIKSNVAFNRNVYIDTTADSATLSVPGSTTFGADSWTAMSGKVSVSDDDMETITNHHQVTFENDDRTLFSIWVEIRKPISKDIFLHLLDIAGEEFKQGEQRLTLTETDSTKNIPFILGETFVSGNMTVSVEISDLPTVLFEETDEGTYNIYETNNPEVKGDDPVVRSSITNSWCFDNLGTLYVLSGFDADNGLTTIWRSLEKNININCSASFDSIAYDCSTDTLYGKNYMTVYSLQQTSGTWSVAKTYTLKAEGSSFDGGAGTVELSISECFAVNNNTVYVTDGVSTLYSGSLSQVQGGSVTLNKCADLTSDINCSDAAYISDITYQDGCVYMLLRDYNVDSSSFPLTSRGAVIRYANGNVSKEGWISDKIQSAGAKLPGYYSGEKKDETKDIDDIDDFVIYANDDNEDTGHGLYGPSKFVCIKPRKLVIADDGVAFYTDNENYLKCKNVNNVVEVDLDSFSLGNNQSTDAGFKSDIDGIDVETGDTYYWRIELD